MEHPIHYIKGELNHFYSEGEVAALTRLILEKGIGVSFVDVLTCKFKNLSEAQRFKITEIVRRLKKYEPIQYIFGETEFWGLPFSVEKSVLIPRPETEELVQWVIDSTSPTNPKHLLDIGTGSGCIAVVLAKKMRQTNVWAWDVSEEALEVARRNALLNNVSIHFSQKDILQEQNDTPEKFDVIVSNPPYITENEKKDMEQNVLDFEPHLALFVSNNNPLIFYEKISDFALKSLKKEGSLFFEINKEKRRDIERMLYQKGFENIEYRKDMSGNERMIKADRK